MSTAAASTKSSFGQTLHFITEIKLQELETQRLAYKEHAKVLDEAKALRAGEVLKQVEILAKAIRSWTGSGGVKDQKIVGGKLQLDDLEFWLQQAKKDPSFSRELAEGWAETLEQHVRHSLLRFDAAKLFGTLFNEWLASGDSSAVAYQSPDVDVPKTGSETDSDASSFVDVGRKEMHEQKEKLMSIVFDEYQTDEAKLKAYLEGLFESEEAQKALERMRKELTKFSYWFKRRQISKNDVRLAIRGLLSTGQMDEEKRNTLKAFQDNQTVLDELASVLNMRMANLKSWTWPKEGALVEFRRHLNGKYRAFTDPEIIDALLMQYIGAEWQVKIKSSLYRLFDSKAWIRPPPPKHEVKERLVSQLGYDNSTSIETQRNVSRREHFFVSQLLDNTGKIGKYEDLIDDPDDGSSGDYLSPVQIKRLLLNMMNTECYLNKAIHGSHTALVSDLEWFGPSLPHKSILTVLEFMGMSKVWLGFYREFLAVPIRFQGETEPRVRKRGTPIDFTLSVVCGEAILFMMDFAVNQRAKGLFLHRMHDDLWLWDHDPKKVAAGWKEMNTFASLVGLKFNKEKTGAAHVGPADSDTLKDLPTGDIRWGFLKFDPKEARFVIDQNDVDKHIAEMRRQLASTKSVFGWVNAYNKYMAFFLRNFGGPPANCVGREHVADMIDTLGRVQRELFPDAEAKGGNGGAVGYLRKTIEERFGTKDLPEGYFYFPISSGGLELRNTLLELLSLERREKPLAAVKEEETTASAKSASKTAAAADEDDDDVEPEMEIDDDPDYFTEDKHVGTEKFVKRLEHDKRAFAKLKDVWDTNADNRRNSQKGKWTPEDDVFMTFEEYAKLREEWLQPWGESYRDMLATPQIREVTQVPKVRELTERGDGAKKWHSMDWYERWVVSLYGEEVVKKFGGLEAVDPNLIPIGMVQLFKSSRMKLDQ